MAISTIHIINTITYCFRLIAFRKMENKFYPTNQQLRWGAFHLFWTYRKRIKAILVNISAWAFGASCFPHSKNKCAIPTQIQVRNHVNNPIRDILDD